MNTRIAVRVIQLMLTLAVMAAVAGLGVLMPQNAAAEPAFDFKPKSGPSGTKVKLTATGLNPNEELTLEGNGKALCSFTSSNNGKGGCTFKVKGSKDLKLTLTGSNVSRSDVGTFTVTKDDKDREGGNNGGNGGGSDRGGSRGGDRGDPGIADRILHPFGRCADDPDRCRRFADDAENARRVASCLLDTPLFAGCRLPGDDTPPDPVGSALQCLQAQLLLVANPLVGFPSLLLGACGENPIDTSRLPDPPLTNAADPGCAFGQPASATPECLGGASPDTGNLTPVNIPAEPGPDNPSVSPDDLPTFGDILDSLNTPSSAPSASLVQEQHDEIRAGVCANVPAGPGGCP